MDDNFVDATVPVTPIIPNNLIKQESQKIILKDSKTDKLIKFGFIMLVIILILFMIFFVGGGIYWFISYKKTSSTLINKYSNLQNKISQFTNKDQIEFENNNYDIHYLVEQMIYKEFTPSDQKKYLNLSNSLKDSLLIDYLITKI
jgi:hypothetical protein